MSAKEISSIEILEPLSTVGRNVNFFCSYRTQNGDSLQHLKHDHHVHHQSFFWAYIQNNCNYFSMKNRENSHRKKSSMICDDMDEPGRYYLN